MNLVGAKFEPIKSALYRFTGDSVSSEGVLNLPMELGTHPCQHIQSVNFVVVDCPSSYNAIIGRPTLNAIRAVTSTYHLLVKFPTVGGIGVLKGDQQESRDIYEAANRPSNVHRVNIIETPGGGVATRPPATIMIGNIEVKLNQVRKFDELDPREPSMEQHGEPVEELEEIPLFEDDLTKTCKIGSSLTGQLRTDLINFLRDHRDVFAWSHEDMPGIDPKVIVHRLNIDPSFRPVKQKRRTFNAERYMAINTEVDKLLKADFIREANYPEWIANVVLVKKANGNWRVCVDFTDLNKACPKDSFPLPRIDQLVDATAGHELLSFMDAYSGYNQIRMHQPDQEHTAFLTDQGLYCYKVMPFGLKNAGATYQRLVNKMFKQQIGRTMEVYVDDMLVKSLKADKHIDNLRESFEVLREYKMKLNPAKCAFGVTSGKFLGFMVNHRGIEANPAKIQALLDMESPRKVKEVQSLTGRVAALNRFISRATDKCQPFFRALRKGKDFSWTAECEQSFQELKTYLGRPPLLSKPQEGESLILYLAVSKGAVSSALIREEEGVQWPIYYTSKSLLDAETRYPEVEKLALALMIAARKLRPYFQAHTIIVPTKFPLKQILQKPDTSGRLAKWSIELGEFDILFKPRTAIKGQALADFIAEFTYQPTSLESAKELVPSPSSLWHLYVDGSSTDNCSGAGVILVSPEKVRLINSEYQAKGEKMASYLEKAKELLGQFDTVTITQIPRNENTNADALARLATGLEDSLLKTVPLEILDEPSIDKHQQVDAISDKPTWMDPIIAYLRDGTLPQDKFEARRLRYRSARYFLDKDKLRKRSFSSPSLTCLNEDQANMWKPFKWSSTGTQSTPTGILLAYHPSRLTRLFAIDYYTKWVEAEALAKITEQNVTNFIWKHIICRFGIPRELVSDHGTQFENERLRATCRNLGITKIFSSPAHPKSNGQVEAVNKTIKYTLKKKLEKSKGAWVDELPLVLWSYRTSFRTTTGETPFSLAYGVDAVVPVELGIPTFRIENFTEEDNDVLLALASDLLEEKRDKAQLRATALQQTVARHYNSKVKLRRFTKGDLVIRRIFLNTKEKGVGVLGPNWEGPYRVRAILRSGTYELETLGGRVLANPWNAEHLKKYYQ
ncbi:hypothetical protein UlMin_033590 [Ulmus minor]